MLWAVFLKKLGTRVRQLRTERSLSPAQVAWEAEQPLSRYHLSNIEAGRKSPSLRVLWGVARRIGVEPFELLVFPGTGLLAEVVDLICRLPPQRLKELLKTLKQEQA